MKISGFSKKNKHCIEYPNFETAIRPILHSNDLPIPKFTELPSQSAVDDILEDIEMASEGSDTEFDPGCFESGNISQKFTQPELNDLVRDLNLPKKSAELLASRLNQKNVLGPNTYISFYRKREEEFLKYFTSKDDLVYCCDIPGLIKYLGAEKYDSNEWRLFIDSSKRSLKCVLLHNGNLYGSIPIGHSTKLKEKYEHIEKVLSLINYNEHQWIICVDLKMVNFLLGQQGGYTKYPCFLCFWDSRDKENHYIKQVWPERTELKIGEKNVINQPLVNRNKIVFPPLHIKLGLMKQFVKALDTNGECFKYIILKFPSLSYEKIKAGIFDGPQIRSLIRDSGFANTMRKNEKNAWLSFKDIVEIFLGNHRAKNYEDIVSKLLDNYKKLGCNMSIKLHFLKSHLDQFPTNLGAVSDEQGERFHQDIRTMEERYQGRWDTHMMADYCWSLKRDLPSTSQYTRKSYKRKFLPQ